MGRNTGSLLILSMFPGQSMCMYIKLPAGRYFVQEKMTYFPLYLARLVGAIRVSTTYRYVAHE